MKTCTTPNCDNYATLQLLGKRPICRKCGDEKNRKSRIRSAKRRSEGHYSPSIFARKKKPKSLGQIAYEASWGLPLNWSELSLKSKSHWERAAKAVKRAVLKRMKEGK